MSRPAGGSNRRTWLRNAAVGMVVGHDLAARPSCAEAAAAAGEAGKVALTPAHLAALERRRQIVVNYDTNLGAPEIGRRLAGRELRPLMDAYFSMFDAPDIRVDGIWWCWLDGNYANYPSKVLPMWDLPGFRRWRDAGIDPVRAFAEETRRRGLEAFLSYRLNGTDMDEIRPLTRPLLKHEHPDWLIQAWDSPGNPGYWNFAVPEVRDYKLRILRELAENYDYDGLEVDFARVPITLPPGHQWEHRDHLTEFMATVRAMTLEEERRRGRPLLLAARVPENLEACHFDGIDVEAWARGQLVDILVLGNRSFDVDLAAFRRAAAGTPIKLLACLDDHHASDGYQHPPIEVFRGVFANWRSQGADGIQTFNFANCTPAASGVLGFDPDPAWEVHHRVYQELGDPGGQRLKDKTFVVQRRGGGHGPTVVANPEDWRTPRLMCYLTNMLAPLPARLANDGKADTLLTVAVADDLSAAAEHVDRITVRLLLSDPAAEGRPASERLEPVTIATQAHFPGPLRNVPPLRGIEGGLELRLNNRLLGRPAVAAGWLEFAAEPRQFAVGNNLVGVRVTSRPPDARAEILIEKLEVHVHYGREGRRG